MAFLQVCLCYHYFYILNVRPPTPPPNRDEVMAAKAAESLKPSLALPSPTAALGAGRPRDTLALQRQAWHHGMLGGVSAEHPAFSGTVRLAARWVGAHLGGAALSQEATELITVAVFSTPSPLPPPGRDCSSPLYCTEQVYLLIFGLMFNFAKLFTRNFLSTPY